MFSAMNGAVRSKERSEDGECSVLVQPYTLLMAQRMVPGYNGVLCGQRHFLSQPKSLRVGDWECWISGGTQSQPTPAFPLPSPLCPPQCGQQQCRAQSDYGHSLSSL